METRHRQTRNEGGCDLSGPKDRRDFTTGCSRTICLRRSGSVLATRGCLQRPRCICISQPLPHVRSRSPPPRCPLVRCHTVPMSLSWMDSLIAATRFFLLHCTLLFRFVRHLRDRSIFSSSIGVCFRVPIGCVWRLFAHDHGSVKCEQQTRHVCTGRVHVRVRVTAA